MWLVLSARGNRRRHGPWHLIPTTNSENMATMPGKRDYYEVLQIERTVSSDEISVAYRKLAIQFHPDKNPGDDAAVERFKEAAEAFEILSDENKRARYDQHGHAGVDGAAGGSPHFSDINDIFEAFGDIFGGGGGGSFGDLFGGGRRRRGPRRGGDVRADITLDLFEAARGTKRIIKFDRHEACENCDGNGAKPGTTPDTCGVCGGRGQVVQSSGVFRVQTTCPQCRGTGSVIKEVCAACRGKAFVLHTVEREVRIPAGVDDQTRLRLEREGEPSPSGGGMRGDCYCFVHVKEHELFRREGQHLICEVPITFSQAALGATIQVPTLDGPDDFDVPAGTQPNDVFRLRGRGMPHPRRGGNGDLLVQVVLEVPKHLDPEHEELLRQMAEMEHANVTPHRKSFFEKLKGVFAHQESLDADADSTA
jgi:molecular chaperone DnaJ